MPNKDFRRLRAWCAAGVMLAALVVYGLTLAPTISFWDCGEYVTTAHILGIPHQPGTPLYVLVGRCFDILLFWLSTAMAVNFMSAFFSALGVMFIFLVISDLARRAEPDSGWLAEAAGLVGALFLLFSHTYWNSAIEAEVYGLAGFMVALLTWLGLRWYDAREQARSDHILYLTFYLLGLGVGFHLGSLLVYPGIFLLIVLARGHRLAVSDLVIASLGPALFLLSTILKSNGLLLVLVGIYVVVVAGRALTGRRFAAVAAGLFLLGLSAHLYLLIRAGQNPAINQSQPSDLGALMSVLRREQYPPLNPLERQAPLGWQFSYYYGFLRQQFTFLSGAAPWLETLATALGPLFLGLLGAVHGLRRARPWIWTIVAGYLINGELLTLYLNFTNHEVRERDYFYGTAFMFFAILIGLGAAALLRWAAGPEARREPEPAAEPARAGAAARVAAARGRAPSPAAPPAAPVAPATPVTPVTASRLAKAGVVVLLVIAALPALQPGHRKWFEHDRSQNWLAREYAWNMLAGLDQGAVLFTNGDNDTFPIWYLQEVEGFRRDVTVMNLSLVNLPWYTQQMRRRDPQLPLSFSDEQIERLEPRAYEDRQTGQRGIVWVRDYIVNDVVTTNRQRPQPRPVFFAVTIPRENMERYYPFLQMEGLAFRLTEQRRRDNEPGVDPERLLRNMYGAYDYTALFDGDTRARWSAYHEEAGLPLDVAHGGRPSLPPAPLSASAAARLDYPRLAGLLGEKRTDVYRDQNTTNLLGNYTIAAFRCGYEFLTRAQGTSLADTVVYDRRVDQAMAAMELARRFDPGFSPAQVFYPMLLVEKGRIAEALASLESLSGRVSPQEEAETLFRTLLAVADAGQRSVAVDFLEKRIATAPRERTGYDVLFNLHHVLGDVAAARAVMDRWTRVTGVPDPDMSRALQAPAGPAGAQPPAGTP